jgi:glyoxylase-like metal-dependent hydrolase (beta-lactamase superfamily II)
VEAVNVFLYKGDALTLFDAGTFLENAYGVLQCRLREIGIEIRDIEQIMLTHHHLDHIGLSRRIKDESGAVICGHSHIADQIALMRTPQKTREHLEALLPELGTPEAVVLKMIAAREHFHALTDDFVIDEMVEDKAILGPFQVHFRPGHSDTDTVYVHQKDRWAVTGDHLIEHVTPNPILRYCPSGAVREKSLVQYCNTLEKTRALDISWCFAGHGAPFKNHGAVVDATFNNIHRRSNRILRLMPPTGGSPFEIMRLLFPHIPPKTFYYCLSAAAGHLELLECEGRLRSESQNGILHYFPVVA